MKIKIFEKFTEADYKKAKKKKEKRMIQKLGNKFIVNIVKEGDFDGLNYLLDKGYDISEAGNLFPNLFVAALQNDQFKMIDYLLQSDYAGDDYAPNSAINCVSLPDIIGNKKFDGSILNITPKIIEMLKTMVEYGYNFDSNYNLLELYLTESTYPSPTEMKKVLIPGIEPFIDWLLENYPENYKLCKNVLPDNLKKKYEYLEVAINYNI